jgi:hypothetical protein
MPAAPNGPKPNAAGCAKRKPFRTADFFSGLLSDVKGGDGTFSAMGVFFLRQQKRSSVGAKGTGFRPSLVPESIEAIASTLMLLKGVGSRYPGT